MEGARIGSSGLLRSVSCQHIDVRGRDLHAWLSCSSRCGSAEITCDRAKLTDGQHILELGCGWGSLSLYMAAKYPGGGSWICRLTEDLLNCRQVSHHGFMYWYHSRYSRWGSLSLYQTQVKGLGDLQGFLLIACRQVSRTRSPSVYLTSSTSWSRLEVEGLRPAVWMPPDTRQRQQCWVLLSAGLPSLHCSMCRHRAPASHCFQLVSLHAGRRGSEQAQLMAS